MPLSDSTAAVEPNDVPQVSPRNTLNDLTAKEWLSESVSVWTQRGLGASHAEARIERLHPAPFSFQDVGRLIGMFTKIGMRVLDPFAGVGSTLKASALMDREGIGIELNPYYVDLARERLRTELPADLDPLKQTIHEGDVRVVADKLEPGSVDFIVTSPPYWGILNKKPDHKVKAERVDKGLDVNYGNDPRDLASIETYEGFIDELAVCLMQCSAALANRKHLALIVGDFRHGGRYYPFHADIARALEERGFVLKAMNVLYQRHKRVFPYGYPAAYVSNVHHQNIVIMRKDFS